MAEQHKLVRMGLVFQPVKARNSPRAAASTFARSGRVDNSRTLDLKVNDWMQANLARSDYLQAALVASACASSAAIAIIGSWVFLRDGSLFNMPPRWLMLLGCSAAVSGLLAAAHCLRKAKYDRVLNRMVDELRD